MRLKVKYKTVGWLDSYHDFELICMYVVCFCVYVWCMYMNAHFVLGLRVFLVASAVASARVCVRDCRRVCT